MEAANVQFDGSMTSPQPMTLDEPVVETIVSKRGKGGNESHKLQMRDVRQVGAKLKVVLLPSGNQEGVLEKLKNWDLWGPLLICLMLSM